MGIVTPLTSKNPDFAVVLFLQLRRADEIPVFVNPGRRQLLPLRHQGIVGD